MEGGPFSCFPPYSNACSHEWAGSLQSRTTPPNIIILLDHDRIILIKAVLAGMLSFHFPVLRRCPAICNFWHSYSTLIPSVFTYTVHTYFMTFECYIITLSVNTLGVSFESPSLYCSVTICDNYSVFT